MTDPTRTAPTAASIIARASDRWQCAGITVTTESSMRRAHAGLGAPLRRVEITTIRIEEAIGGERARIVIGEGITIEVGRDVGPISAARALALVEARIEVWIARSALGRALREAEEAATAALYGADEEAA